MLIDVIHQWLHIGFNSSSLLFLINDVFQFDLGAIAPQHARDIFSPSVTTHKLSMCGDDILDCACKALIAHLFLHLGETDESHLNGWINNVGMYELIQEFIWWKRPIFTKHMTEVLTLETADEAYLI